MKTSLQNCCAFLAEIVACRIMPYGKSRLEDTIMSIIQWKQTEINLLCKSRQIIVAFLIVLIGFNVTWAEFDNPAAWEFFDPSANGVGLDPKGNVNGAFDGRYIYFAPLWNNTEFHAEVLRYDTRCESNEPFINPNCWTTFDYGKAIGDSNIAGYTAVIYDGSRYLYFNPWVNRKIGDNQYYHGNVLRHDTHGEFTDPNAWLNYDLADINDTYRGFGGFALDGKYIYMSTSHDSNIKSSVARYDTTKDFNVPNSWEVFQWDDDFHYNCVRPVFDGQYVYFARRSGDNRIIRYDTNDPDPNRFANPIEFPGAWEQFYTHTKDENLKDFTGSAYAHPYVYFVTWRPWHQLNSLILRYDTNSYFDFTDPLSWEVHESNDTYVEIVYDDERYLYFTPRNDDDATGQFLRFDTTKDFNNDPCAWKYFDPGENGVGENLKNYHGGVSDGHYVYFTPWEIKGSVHGEILRYDSKYVPYVLSPNGGETWVSGTTQDIEWGSDANIPEVKIEYSVNNGQDWNDVDVNTVPNSGAYEWLVPEVTSEECLIRISDVNNPNIYDVSDDVFTIFECLKKLTGDLDNNCYVNLNDVALLAQDWLECGNPFDPTCTINNDLIAYYPFSGDATDATGNGHDGTIHGATLCEDKYTDPNKAYNFDGADYIAVPDHPALTLGAEPFTIGAWAKLSGFGADGGYYLMGHSNGPGNTNKWIFWLGNSGISFVATPTGWIGLGSYAFELGSWYHVAITRSGTVLTAYVNGYPIGTGTLNGPIYDPSTAFFIGTAEFDRPARPFRGCIDEVRIYNRALTCTEIEYLYNAQQLKLGSYLQGCKPTTYSLFFSLSKSTPLLPQ